MSAPRDPPHGDPPGADATSAEQDASAGDRHSALGEATAGVGGPEPAADPAVAALRRAAALRAAMLDALPAPVCLLDPWGVIVAGNAPWRRLVEGAGCPHEWAGVGSPYAVVLQALRADPAADLSPVWRFLLEPGAAAPGATPTGAPPTLVLRGASGPVPYTLLFTRVGPEGGGGLLVTHLPGLPAPAAPSPGEGRPTVRPADDPGRTPVGGHPSASVPVDPPPQEGARRGTPGPVPTPPPIPLVGGAIHHPAGRRPGSPEPGPEQPPAGIPGASRTTEPEPAQRGAPGAPPTPALAAGSGRPPAPEVPGLAAARYRAIVEGLEAGILVVEPDGTVRAANPAAGALLGTEPARLVGQSLVSLGREAPGVLERAWESVNRTGRARGIHRFRGTQGRDRFLAWSARAGIVEGRHLVVLRLPDEIQGGDDPLRQARKLEALGQVTGGIAHEINNVLTVILAGIDIVLEEQGPTDGIREELERVRRAADRGADTVRRLLTFSRRQGETRRPVDLGEIIRGMEDLLDRVLPGRITLRIEIQDPSPLAVAGPGDVEEILLNLASNARDAMAGGGTLEIRLRRVTLSGPEAEPLGVSGGDYLALTVRDSGTGMSPAVLERAFDPFFTTKGVEGGTGLGLSLVYGLMREHGGAVGIRSAPGAGTSVSLWFPAVAIPDPAPRESPPPAPVVSGDPVVLLVEDDDAIRSATSRILERFGYRVITAADGDEAMDLLSREQVHLVVSDVVMPRAGGLAVYQAARALAQPPRFLFMSGYAASEISGFKELPAEVRLLSKPWTAKELLDAVREALEP